MLYFLHILIYIIINELTPQHLLKMQPETFLIFQRN